MPKPKLEHGQLHRSVVPKVSSEANSSAGATVSVKAEAEKQLKARGNLLVQAVEAMAPIIALLRARREEGGKVDFYLRAPTAASGPVEGYLQCASLDSKANQTRGPVDHDISFENGMVTVAWPPEGSLDPDDDHTEIDRVCLEPQAVADLIRSAEVREALVAMGGVPGFKL